LGASKCVPVCSPVRKLFQYHAGPRSSYRLSSSSSKRAVCANWGGSAMTGVSADSGAVRSTTSMLPAASAAASYQSSPTCSVLDAGRYRTAISRWSACGEE
jgi:hypothetical protein